MLDVWPHLLLLWWRHCLGLPQTVLRRRPLEHGRRTSRHDRSCQGSHVPLQSPCLSQCSARTTDPHSYRLRKPLSSMSRTMSITQGPNTLTPVTILSVTLSILVMWIYVTFPLHLRQPIFSLNPLVQSNTKKPSSFYSYTTPATPSNRFISTSISSRVPCIAYRFPTSCPRIRYFCDYVTSAKHYAITTLWISCSSAWKQVVFLFFHSGFLVAEFKKNHVSVLE